MPKRCALGCTIKPGVSYHQFPHLERNPDRFKAWVQIVGGKLDTPNDYEYYRKKVICDIHFRECDKNRNNRLNFMAVPTLHLKGLGVSDDSGSSEVTCVPVPAAPVQPAPVLPAPVLPAPVLPAHESTTPVSFQPSIVSTKIVTGLGVSDDSGSSEVTCVPVPAAPVQPAPVLPAPVLPAPVLPAHESTTPVSFQPSIVSTKIVTGLGVSDDSGSSEVTCVPVPAAPVQPAPVLPAPVLPAPVLPAHESTTPVSFQPSIVSTKIVTGLTDNIVPRSNQPSTSRPVLRGTKYGVESASPLIREQLQTSRRKLKNLHSELNRLRKRSNNFKARLASVLKMSKDHCMLKITENMTAAAKIFTKMQCMQTHKKSKGRRFSLEEKVLSLSIYKKSPKCYTLLASYFTLPSPKSLKRLMAEVKIESGLNKAVFLKLKETVKQMDTKNRLCSLIFDEMSITPQIHYDASKDKLRGFAWRSKNFADHVLVYMIKGIRKNFKQPVAYYFTNCLNKSNLKDMTLNVIKYVQSTGLNILCTVCDQSTTNVSAINEMINDTKRKFHQQQKEWRYEVIEVSGKEIIPLFDVPHLLKGVRNNLLTKNLKYYDFEEKVEKTIKWEYYQKIYEADKSYGELNLLQKLTDEHIYVQKMKKMKVKAAAQVFSHSVAVAAEHLTARGACPVECRQIIKFTKIMDNLFDSLNASTFHISNGKLYKSCVRKNSPHHQLWIDALKLLKTVKFIKCKKDNDKIIECTVPSINNFIRTIEGIRHLWQILSEKYAFDAMLTRNFNQDPLENFFGNIRSYGVRNTAPNTINFEGAYKSLLLNNFSTPHSIKGNCENDENNALQSLDFFLKEISNVPNDEAPLFQNNENEEIVVPCININLNEPKDFGQANYVCGWVLAKCLKNITKSCKICKIDMVGDKNTSSNAFIRAREYKINAECLVYPSKCIETCFIQLQELVTNILKENVPKTKLKEKINMFADILVDYPFKCENHKNQLKLYFNNTVTNVLIYSWCRTINRILSGKIQYDGEDEVKLAAQAYYKKHTHNK